MPIFRKECRINNLYVIDTRQFDLEAITTVFCWYDGETALLMDIGTSDNIDAVFDSMSRFGIPPEKLAGITLSHYHFDHAGGCAELWNRMKSINSGFRIYTSALTKEKLQSSSSHVKGAGTTFGKFVGTMEPLPDEAFHILEFDSLLPLKFNDGSRVKLLHTPGHTPDHCSPSVFIDGECIFCFAAEACGTMYTNRVILSTPSSMPPNFRYGDYMKSIEIVRALDPGMIGLCHFGVISGSDDLDYLFNDHIVFMNAFRDGIIKAFSENPSTGHVLKSTEHLWDNRIDSDFAKMKGSGFFFDNLKLALTYGVMIDLGFRPPKYEGRTPQQ